MQVHLHLGLLVPLPGLGFQAVGIALLAAVVLVHEIAEVVVIGNGLRAIRTERPSQPEDRNSAYPARSQRLSTMGTR